MNAQMTSQDSNKYRMDLSSTNKGIESFKKTPIKTFNSFTPSPLTKVNIHEHSISGNLDSISTILNNKYQEDFFLDPEIQTHSDDLKENNKNNYNYNYNERNFEENKKKSKYQLEIKKSNNEDQYFNFNPKNGKEKNSPEIFNSSGKSIGFSNQANLNSPLITNNNNLCNNNSHTTNKNNKEKSEDAAPLTSNLKNFLQNYDDLLGVIDSNSKSSTMTSNFSNEYNNLRFSISDHMFSQKKEDAKSKTTKNPQTNYYKISNFADSEIPIDDKKFNFSTNIKSKKSAEINPSILKSFKNTGDSYQNNSLSLKKNISDIPMTQSKRSKEFESSLIKMNPIIEEDQSPAERGHIKNGNSRKNTKDVFTIIPKPIINDDNENEDNDLDNSNTDSATKLDSKNDSNSVIMLNPIIANVTINANKLHIDTLITSQIRKQTSQPNQAEDRNFEETKIVQNLTNTEEIKDFYEYTEECLKRIIKLETPSLEEIKDLLFDLPFDEELKVKKLAIFDLDETLIHCEIKKPSKGHVQIMVNLPSGDTAKIGLNIRPFWKECLKELSKYYLIIVYTASHKSYADSVLDYLDPNKELIKYRLYRHNCVKVKMESEFIYVKDLRIFNNVKMEDMIIIDNSVLSFAFQLENGIPILPFYDNKEDVEMKFLANYLGNIYKMKDLRVENNRSIKMLYFLNAVKDKMEGKITNDNEELNDDSYSETSNKKDQTNNLNKDHNSNSNSMFKISLFSAEANNNDVSYHSENPNEVSFSNSESSHNDSSIIYNSNNKYDITNKLFNNKTSNKGDNNNSNAYDGQSSENSNTEGNIEIKPNKVSKRNNKFQEKLFSTLDDLKKTFTKLSEKKRNSTIIPDY